MVEFFEIFSFDFSFAVSFLFPKRKTFKEVLNECQREVRQSIVKIDRERQRFETTEKQTKIEMKKLAKKGEMAAVREMAKDIVRTRASCQRFLKMRTQLQAVSLRLKTTGTQQALFQSMRGVTRMMMVMNRQMNLPAIQRIMMQFEMQTQQLDMKMEMVDDTIDDVNDTEETKEEEDVLVNQVLDELGIAITAQMADAPQTQIKSTEAERLKQKELAEDEDLMARLKNLKGGGSGGD